MCPGRSLCPGLWPASLHVPRVNGRCIWAFGKNTNATKQSACNACLQRIRAKERGEAMLKKMQELQGASAGSTHRVQWDLQAALDDQMDSVTWVRTCLPACLPACLPDHRSKPSTIRIGVNDFDD